MAQNTYEEQVQGEIFYDRDEKLLCTAGSPQLERYLKTGKIAKGFTVLSDRAIYCKGRCRTSRDRRNFSKEKADLRIDLEEFQDLRLLKQRNPVLLTLAFFFLILGPTLMLLNKLVGFGDNTVLNPTLDAAICILLSGVFFLLYSIHTRSLLELRHTNGSIRLNQKDLPEKEERLFIRYLRAYLRSRAPQTES